MLDYIKCRLLSENNPTEVIALCYLRTVNPEERTGWGEIVLSAPSIYCDRGLDTIS